MDEFREVTNPFTYKGYEVLLEKSDEGFKIVFTGDPYIPAVYSIECNLEAIALAEKIINNHTWQHIATINGYEVSVKQNLDPGNKWAYQCVKGDTTISENICETLSAVIKSGINAAKIAE